MEVSEENFRHLTENRVLVVIPFGTKIYLKGKAQIFAIYSNSIDIFGAKFDANSNFPIDVFSPRGYSLLCFEALQNCGAEAPKELKLPSAQWVILPTFLGIAHCSLKFGFMGLKFGCFILEI